MEKNVSGILTAFSVLALAMFCIVGLVTYSMGSNSVVVPEAEVCPVVEIPEAEIITEIVASASEYIIQAEADFIEYVDDEELFTCDGHEYNFDEISVARLYSGWNLDFDDEDYTVAFSIKLEYDEDDEKSCKETFDVKAFYEEGEDVEVTVA